MFLLIEGREHMDNRKISIISSIGYIALMAIAMYTSSEIFHYNYRNPEIIKVLIYFEIIMAIYSIFIYRKYFKGTSFKKIKISYALIVFAIAITVAVIVYIVTGDFKGHSSILITIVITTFLVGVSEELMFRGIVFSGIEEKNGTLNALIYSSLLFSLLHAVNVFGGLPFKSMIIQMILTFVYGILAGGIRVKSNNIFPFMIFHFLWDMMVFTNPIVKSHIDVLSAGMIILECILAVILFVSIFKNQRKYNM